MGLEFSDLGEKVSVINIVLFVNYCYCSKFELQVNIRVYLSIRKFLLYERYFWLSPLLWSLYYEKIVNLM